MDQQNLEKRLAEIENRLNRLETALKPAESESTEITQKTAVTPELTDTYETSAPPLSPPVAPPTEPDPTPEIPASPYGIEHSPAPPTTVVTSSKSTTSITRQPITPPASTTKQSTGGLEVAIGMKVTAWVGALVIIIGAALLVKLGIDSGLWGNLPPALRASGIAALGFIFIAIGEIALRRISRSAAAGLFSAGLGILYLDVFAMFRYFELLSQAGALILLAIVALIGFAITLRSRLLAVGIVSLIGGYASPLMIQGSSVDDILFGAFITVLYATALGLSAIRPIPFRPLRAVALGFQTFVGFFWFASSALSNAPEAALVFSTLWWGMTSAEAIFAAIRRQSARSNCIVTLIATGLYVTGGSWLLHSALASGANWLGIFTFAVALVSIASAFMFGDPVRGMRKQSRFATDLLGVSFVAQAGILLVVATAQQFDGFAESVSWLAIAIGAIELGRRLPSRGVDVFGLIVGGLALMRILLIDWWLFPGLTQPFYTGLGLELTPWILLGMFGVVALISMAFRLRGIVRSIPERRPWGRPALILLAGLYYLLVTGFAGESLPVNVIWLAGITVLLLVAPYVSNLKFPATALVMLFVFAMKTVTLDMPGHLPGSRDLVGLGFPWLNGLTLSAVLAAGLAFFSANRLSIRDDSSSHHSFVMMQVIQLVAVVFLTITFSWQILHSMGALNEVSTLTTDSRPALFALVALWGAAGFILLTLGKQKRPLLLVGGGMLVILICFMYYVIYLTLRWRVDHGVTSGGMVFINPSAGSGLALLTASWLGSRQLRTSSTIWFHDGETTPAVARLILTLRSCSNALLSAVCLLGLCVGSIEIERAFSAEPMAGAAAISVYWALFGVGLVMMGFIRLSSVVRYAGLLLLTIAVGKVVIFDLAYVERIWRILSFFGSGGLLVGTSILYAKLSPRLLESLSQRDR